MLVHRLEKRSQQEQELPVFDRVFGRGKQIDPIVGGKRIVVVLARTVDPVERLFMEQTSQSMYSWLWSQATFAWS